MPSSRVMMNLRGEARRIAERLEAIASADGVDGFLLGELRWLSGLMAAFARYGQEDFDAWRGSSSSPGRHDLVRVS